jgi:hypothetical protein
MERGANRTDAKSLKFLQTRKNQWVRCRKLIRSECRRLRCAFWEELAADMQKAFDTNEAGLFFSKTRNLFESVYGGA